MLVIIITRHEFGLNRIIATPDAHTHTLSHPNILGKKTHGCAVITKIYTQDTTDIRCHKETQKSYKYDLLATTKYPAYTE
jgi:hypothetical protein